MVTCPGPIAELAVGGHYYVRQCIASRNRKGGGPVDLGGLGRFTDPAVLILSSLAGGPKHGYALIGDIEEFAGVALGPGTLYGALARLERRGLIEALAADDRRHPYGLTATGTAALRDYLTQAQAVASVGLLRLGET